MKHPSPADPAATAETRRRLIEASRALFAQEGYAKVSLNDVLAEVGQTKGAIYYHFRDKRHLFQAVVEVVEAEVVAHARIAYDACEDPRTALVAWTRTFLAELRRPDVLRIMCIDAGAVLTWDECAALDEAMLLSDLREFVSRTRPGETLDPLELDAASRIVIGAIYQVAGWIVRGDQERHTETVENLVVRIIEAIPASLTDIPMVSR